MGSREMAKRYTAPKAIIGHPGVEECLSGEGQSMDYKHAVWLKAGWEFKYGRMAGCRTGNFHTVKAFRNAEPVRTERA